MGQAEARGRCGERGVGEVSFFSLAGSRSASGQTIWALGEAEACGCCDRRGGRRWGRIPDGPGFHQGQGSAFVT